MEHLGLLRDLRWLEVDVMSACIERKEDWVPFFMEYPWLCIFTGCEYSVEDLQTNPEARRMREIWPFLEQFNLGRWD